MKKPRMTKEAKAAEAAFNNAMQKAANGKVIPMLEIPRLFREAREKVAAGMEMNEAAEAVLAPYAAGKAA